MEKLRVEGRWLVDESGRRVLLRGVNLGGSSKLPANRPLQLDDDFSDHRTVSFVGRPFPLEDAPAHYARLAAWGFNALRFLVPWEAVEHAAPGEYDQAYLDYLAEVVALAGAYGFYVIIDPHQDVWSRMTGGDGAPGWTLEAVGFDIAQLDASEAAITLQARYPHYPPMVWTDNYSRLACNTMFTLFFGGQWVAAELEIEGVPVQEFLQAHFIGAMQQVARRLQGMPHVIGYGPMNEPGKGFLGMASLAQMGGFHQKEVQITPADSILLGAGFPRSVATSRVEHMQPVITGDTLLNPAGVSAWQSAEKDIWRAAGVWDFDENGEPIIICDDYFDGLDFLRDGLIPFTLRYAEALRTIQPDAIIFVESTPTEAEHFHLATAQLANMVNAGHWYDEQMLFSKSFDGQSAINRRSLALVQGQAAVQELFNANIAELCQLSALGMGGVPTLIGEFGLAFDINAKQAYQDGDFSLHEKALSMYYAALDANLVHATLWNYTADNTHLWGDGWNQEDLSIFCAEDGGGRAVRGFSRPYVRRTPGELKTMRFDDEQFTVEIFFSDASSSSEVFLPPWLNHVEVSSGMYQRVDGLLLWHNPTVGLQTLTATILKTDN